MALCGGVSVRRERHGVARTRERAKRANATSVARSRDPLSRRENATEISLALVFWWAGVSGYPRDEDETKSLTGCGEDLGKQIAARRDVPAQLVSAGTESLFQRGCVMAPKDLGRVWFVTSLDWKERDRVHDSGSQTRVTRSDEGRMQRQHLLFWGWGSRKDPRKAGTPAPGEDSNCVSSRGGVIEGPDLTKEERRDNIFFSGGGVREGIQVKPGQAGTEENQKVFGGGVGEHHFGGGKETGNRESRSTSGWSLPGGKILSIS
jgi:hypothetical protein